MGQLLETYRPAIRAYLLRRKRVRLQDVDDVIQGFFVSQVIERDLVARAEKERGKFRTFLLTALDHYFVSEIRKQTAKKRSPGSTLDVTVVDPTDTGPRGDQGFEVEWARAIVKQAVDRMAKACQISKQDDVWGVFEARLYRPIYAGQPPTPYAELVRRFQLKSPAHASNMLVTAKRIFTRNLRSVIGEYAIHDDDEIDQEIADLMQILTQSNPRK